MCEKSDGGGERTEIVEAVIVSPDKAGGGLGCDQFQSELVEKVFEGVVVRRAVVSDPERPDQRALRLLEELVDGNEPLARVELVELVPEAFEGFQEISELVLARVVV